VIFGVLTRNPSSKVYTKFETIWSKHANDRLQNTRCLIEWDRLQDEFGTLTSSPTAAPRRPHQAPGHRRATAVRTQRHRSACPPATHWERPHEPARRQATLLRLTQTDRQTVRRGRCPRRRCGARRLQPSPPCASFTDRPGRRANQGAGSMHGTSQALAPREGGSLMVRGTRYRAEPGNPCGSGRRVACPRWRAARVRVRFILWWFSQHAGVLPFRGCKGWLTAECVMRRGAQSGQCARKPPRHGAGGRLAVNVAGTD